MAEHSNWNYKVKIITAYFGSKNGKEVLYVKIISLF